MSQTPEDFNAEISLMRESRPTLSALELDRVKSRVRRRGDRRQRSAWAQFARTRGAVVAAIATGALMSTGGTALGVSGLASSGGASIAQYGNAATPPPGGQVKGDNGGGDPGQGVSPASGQGVSPAEEVAQPPVSSSGQLPFTGFLAIPMLLIGLALVAAGLVARRMGTRTGAAPPS